MTNAIVLVGNPKPGSRTRAVGERLAERLLAGTSHSTTVIDLANYAGQLFGWPNLEVDELLREVANADLVIVASPTYKASYTGLLKAFLDRYGDRGLAGVLAVPLMTCGDPGHVLAADWHLRPLLIELGASVPTQSLSVVTRDLEQLEQRLDLWLGDNSQLAQLLEMNTSVGTTKKDGVSS